MIGRIRLLRRLKTDRRGVTAVEFGLIAPTFIMMLLGVFDLGYTVYARAILEGAVQKAGRDSSLETGPNSLAVIDQRIRSFVGPLGYNAEFTFDRQNYRDFADVNRAEQDDNGNGVLEEGECFIDENNNGTFDQDVGKDGVGGARDVVLYTVHMQYPQRFPLWKFIGGSQTATLTASTVLRNQPYGDQAEASSEPVCPDATP